MKHSRTHLVRFLRGFSLIELLVAMAILSMLMTMMFSLLGGTISVWELGNKRIEAAQTARVGLNIIANDLRRAISDQQISYSTSGGNKTNTIPFVATSDTLYGVLATGKTNQPFEEFGYMCTKNTDANSVMMTGRYYLVRSYSGTNSGSDFYQQGNVITTFTNSPESQFPIIENCIKLEFSYADTNSGAVVFTNTWASQTNLPAGVLVSVWVLDSRAAEKFSSQSPADLTNRAVRMRRFIPLNQH